MIKFTRTYYQIRFTADRQYYYKAGEYYSSNNGTDRWNDLSKVKALLTRGMPRGYKGRTLEPFADYEIVEVTETIEQVEKVITL